MLRNTRRRAATCIFRCTSRPVSCNLRTPIPTSLNQARLASSKTQPITMKTARVTSWGNVPQYTDAPDLPAPAEGEIQLKVIAVGIPRLVRGRAAGKHYSVKDQALPFDPSVDGVGRDEATGDMYFIPPFTAPVLAEKVNIAKARLVKLPADNDPVAVAGLINPVSSSWMALQSRAKGGCRGRNVFVLGATTASGRLAVKIARELGAAKITGASRNQETLDAVEGLDERVLLTEPFQLPPSVGPIHIVLDYVAGSVAMQLLEAAEVERGTDLQFVHIGGVSGESNYDLPISLLRKKAITIAGSGLGSFGLTDIMKQIPELVPAICNIGRPDTIWEVPMSEVESVWNSEEADRKRLVLVP